MKDLTKNEVSVVNGGLVWVPVLIAASFAAGYIAGSQK